VVILVIGYIQVYNPNFVHHLLSSNNCTFTNPKFGKIVNRKRTATQTINLVPRVNIWLYVRMWSQELCSKKQAGTKYVATDIHEITVTQEKGQGKLIGWLIYIQISLLFISVGCLILTAVQYLLFLLY